MKVTLCHGALRPNRPNPPRTLVLLFIDNTQIVRQSFAEKRVEEQDNE